MTMLSRYQSLVLAVFPALMVAALTGCGGSSQPELGNNNVKEITLASRSGSFTSTLDATPSIDGDAIYFLATGTRGNGVFRLPGTGGEAIETMTGAPFVAPRSLTTDTSGKQIYVADPEAANVGTKPGKIFAVPVTGGVPTPVQGTEATTARGLDVVNERGVDVIYFTGNDPADGQPAVFKIAATGASAPAVVLKGAPLVSPDSVTVSKNGIVYISDRLAAGNNLGAVFRLEGNKPTKIADQIRMGTPAGIALNLDENFLFVSAIDRDKNTDQVLLIELASQRTGLVTTVVEANMNGGGIHRAKNANVFAWADRSRGVYRVQPN